MNGTKAFWKSKSFIGSIAVLGSLALRGFGIEVGEPELQATIQTVVEAIGGILALIGRVSATHSLGLTDK